MTTDQTLSLTDLPVTIVPEVLRSTKAQVEYHKLSVVGYGARRSYYSGTPRVCVYIVGTDRDGRPIGYSSGDMVDEIYSGCNGVTSFEFAELWEVAQ